MPPPPNPPKQPPLSRRSVTVATATAASVTATPTYTRSRAHLATVPRWLETLVCEAAVFRP